MHANFLFSDLITKRIIILEMTEMVIFLGFFNMWGFGKTNKQASQPVKKQQENVTSCLLELVGDLIGHSSSVEVLLLIGI